MIITSPKFIGRVSTIVMTILLGFSLVSCAPVIAGLGVATAVATTSEKGLGTSFSDNIIKAKISDNLIKEDVDLFSDADVTVNQGSVLLTGNVNAPEDKIIATQLSWKVKGVVEVLNELQVQDKSSFKDIARDLAAGAQLRAKIIADSKVSSINYSIDVVNGTIYLAGIAADETEMTRVVNHARTVRFAKEVKNYIRINDDDRE